MLVSLIAPAHNEEGNIVAFHDAVVSAFADAPGVDSCELVFVDDGSTDSTLSAMKALSPTDALTIKVISFSRNFGKEAALFAGLEHATGDICVFIDTDMQQPPAVARDMVQRLLDNPDVDCVAAYQEHRKQGALRNFLSRKFYQLLGASSGMNVLADASDFRAFRRPVADALLSMREYYRFSKGLFAWVGFKTLPHPYTPSERLSGTTTWSLRKLFSYAYNGLISFTTVPLNIATWIGSLLSAGSIIYFIVVFIQRLAFGVDVPGYATIVCLILLLGGIQLLVLGVIGKYLARTYIQGKDRPIYIVREYHEL